MRTRLDEIEDRIIRLWHEDEPGPVALLGEGLIEAFRHGVERALIAEWTHGFPSPLTVTPSEVQPAPADPPIGGPYPTDFRWYDGKPAPMTEKCSNCGRVHEPPILCDRRKGERRKPERPGPIYGILLDGGIIGNRRSGKDRRKP